MRFWQSGVSSSLGRSKEKRRKIGEREEQLEREKRKALGSCFQNNKRVFGDLWRKIARKGRKKQEVEDFPGKIPVIFMSFSLSLHNFKLILSRFS